MSLVELPIVAGDGHASLLRLHRTAEPGPGLFWMPALGVPAAKYDAFAKALVAEGVTCAVHEWRGNASSSLRARRGVDWGYRELLQHDLPASIAALDSATRWYFGGHSLGGQLAAMAAARQPHASAGLALVATGVPQASTFRGRQRLGVGLFAGVLPLLTRVAGYYPGHRLGFAGREAGQLMRDWGATVRTGRYDHYGHRDDLDSVLARLQQPVLGVRMTRDWLVPEASMQALLGKVGSGVKSVERFDDARLGARADHFRWMRQPQALAACIAAWMRASP
ncbi:MAG: alpha/beta hydrolase [Arenimonas sp.]|nr:alpha/beta hydrolase [Arenimonas sp.]